MVYFNGIDDQSGRQQVPELMAQPSHFPLIYLYAQDGPETRQIVDGTSAQRIYGKQTLDLRSPYSNHATLLATKLFTAGNQCVVQRIVPTDAGPKATVRLYLDVLETEIPVYVRRADGSIELDEDGLPVETGTKTDGILFKWVAKPVPVISGVDNFGLGTQEAGDQVDAVAGTQSVRYPVADFRVPHFGKIGNNAGLRIWAPTNTGVNPMDARALTEEKFYPFQFAFLTRKDELSTAKLVDTIRAEKSVLASFKPDAFFRATESEMYVGSTLIEAYQSLINGFEPPKWGPFGQLHVYDNSVSTILKKMYVAEAPHATQYSDFGTSVDVDTVEENQYLVNFVSAVSSQNIPYTAIRSVSEGEFVHLSNSSVIFASGGSDGTMSLEAFAEAVSEKIAEYANPNSPLLDSALNPENIVYDSGFPLETKLALLDFISIRKDTNVGLATHDAGGRPLTTSEESSLAVALATRARLHPESTYFGTQTCRVFIMGRSGKFLNSQYKKHAPVLIDQAYKYAQYMGASDGRWKTGYSPNVSPRNIVSSMYDFNATFTPSSVRQNDWASGLNWLQAYDTQRVFVPAMKTVYQDDTSVLTSVITMFACSSLQRIGEQIWRDYVGRDDLTQGQLRQKVEREVEERTRGKFDGRFQIKGEVIFTAADDARGYSWHLNIHIYANNMRTVQVLGVVTHRMEDLESSTN